MATQTLLTRQNLSRVTQVLSGDCNELQTTLAEYNYKLHFTTYSKIKPHADFHNTNNQQDLLEFLLIEM